MLNQLKTAIISVIVLGVLTGIMFPLLITGIAQGVFPHQANGSLIVKNGQVIGSELIGQNFIGPGYFHPRPSAAGNGYDATSSGGTNLGPTSDKLINGIHKKLPDGKDDPGNFDGVKDLALAYRQENGLKEDQQLPADAVTRSASGLDPDISPANAQLQAKRIAKERGLTVDRVLELIDANTKAAKLHVLGEPRINVLQINRALDALAPLHTHIDGSPPSSTH